jgi:hypothetical protein
MTTILFKQTAKNIEDLYLLPNHIDTHHLPTHTASEATRSSKNQPQKTPYQPLSITAGKVDTVP